MTSLYPLQAGLLGASLFTPPLAAILISIDSHFHLTSDLETLQRDSPDWIIARSLFGIRAFGTLIHRAMALVLFIATFAWIWSLANDKTNFWTEWYPLFSKIVVGIILTGVTLKYLVNQQPKK